jgi:hypothetical protein
LLRRAWSGLWCRQIAGLGNDQAVVWAPNDQPEASVDDVALT